MNASTIIPPPSQQPELGTHARALAKQGRLIEAIAAATAQNRIQPDEDLERLLVDWRMRARPSLRQASPGPTWQRDIQDPFPGLSGLPEISARELTTQVMAGAIVHHGALLVRGLISANEASTLSHGIEQAFDGLTTWLADKKTPRTPWFSPAPISWFRRPGNLRQWTLAGGGTLAADSPRMLYELAELLDRTGLINMVTEYFSERPTLSVGKTTLRKIPASLKQSGWHQDGAFLGKEIRTVNLWLTLSDCGRDAPGIDFVPKRIPYIVETGTQGALLNWMVGPGMIDQLTSDSPVCSPEFAAGDALLFDHLFLHRTGLPPGRTKDRYAIESWMFAPSRFPGYQGIGKLLL